MNCRIKGHAVTSCNKCCLLDSWHVSSHIYDDFCFSRFSNGQNQQCFLDCQCTLHVLVSRLLVKEKNVTNFALFSLFSSTMLAEHRKVLRKHFGNKCKPNPLLWAVTSIMTSWSLLVASQDKQNIAPPIRELNKFISETREQQRATKVDSHL